MSVRIQPGEIPEYDFKGQVLTLPALRQIAFALENHGAVNLRGCGTSNGMPVTQWLDSVLREVKTRRTDGKRKE